jgi:hypothetical protein
MLVFQKEILTMNLHIGQSLHGSDRVFPLTNVDVFIVWNDISNGQDRVVANDRSTGRKLSVLPPPSNFRRRPSSDDAAETDFFSSNDRNVFRMFDDERFNWKILLMFFSIRCFDEEKLSSSVPPNSKHFFVATF